jgi:hypothetical protein
MPLNGCDESLVDAKGFDEPIFSRIFSYSLYRNRRESIPLRRFERPLASAGDYAGNEPINNL